MDYIINVLLGTIEDKKRYLSILNRRLEVELSASQHIEWQIGLEEERLSTLESFITFNS